MRRFSTAGAWAAGAGDAATHAGAQPDAAAAFDAAMIATETGTDLAADTGASAPADDAAPPAAAERRC